MTRTNGPSRRKPVRAFAFFREKESMAKKMSNSKKKEKADKAMRK
jgi:hypothetical protein